MYDPSLNPPYNRNISFSCRPAKAPLYPEDQPIVNLTDLFLNLYDIDDGEPTRYLIDNLMLEALKGVEIINSSIPYIEPSNFNTSEKPIDLSPWKDCPQLQQGNCPRLLNSSCDQWQYLMILPDSTTEKGLFLAIVWMTWGSIILAMIIYYLVFNANPDYSSSEAWMQTVEGMSRLFGFETALSNAVTEEGFKASEEFGVLLAQLFGGIDMDLTDKVLGLYLASERMRWRRLKTIKSYLISHGYHENEPERGCIARCCIGIGIDGEEGLQSNFDTNNASVHNGLARYSNAYDPSRVAPHLLPTPFAVSLDDLHAQRSGDQSNTSFPSDSSMISSLMSPPTTITMSHSIVRLESSIKRNQTEEYGRISRVSVPMVKEGNKQVKIMVPVDISELLLDPSIDSKTASALYLDECEGIVSSDILSEALRYSWFAKAAYGLQNKLWKASRTGNCWSDCSDSCLSKNCFLPVSKSLHLSGRFRKRNFDAILRFTGIPAEDFLYVSYTSTSFGLLPYLVMLDRKNKKVIISIRGTVGLEDLITDLLSQPLDINYLLPGYILNRVPKKKDGSPINMYGHAGIIASAKAIIQSLEEQGVLSNIAGHESGDRERIRELVQIQSERFTKDLSALSNDSDVQFSLERAQTAVYDALSQSYDLIVTGHSLGAAVASLVSIKLKENHPSLKCFAFNPPGGLASPELSDATRDFCYSIVVGYDAISRLSIKAVRNLVDDVVFSLCRCKRPKLRILIDILLGNRRDPNTAPKTYCSFEMMDQRIKDTLAHYTSHSLVHDEDLDSRPLCPLGQVIFLRPYILKDESTKKGTITKWDAVYANPSDIIQEGIILSRHSLRHHQISEMQSALEDCIQSQQYDYENI